MKIEFESLDELKEFYDFIFGNQERPLTNAEKQKRYREKQKTLLNDIKTLPSVTETLPTSTDTVTPEKEGEKKEERKESTKEKKEERKEEERDNSLTAAGAKTKTAEPKHKHGSFENVLLTDRELEKLRERFEDADEKIEVFSKSKKAKGYVYASDYAAILKWDWGDKRKAQQPQLPGQQPYKSTYQRLKELGEL